MISVSRAAGYGKFTQTNDPHLPEARDTIEKEGVSEKSRRRGRKEEEERRGLKTRAMISTPYALRKCLPFYPSNVFMGLQHELKPLNPKDMY